VLEIVCRWSKGWARRMTLVWRACSMAAALGRSVTTAAYRRRSLAPAGTGAWLARCMWGAWRRRRAAIGTAWTVCLIGWTGVLLLPDHDRSMVAAAAHDDIRGPAIASSAGRTSNVSMPKPGTVGGQDIAFRSIGPPTRQPAPGGVARPLRFLLVLLAGLGSGGVAAAWLAGRDGVIDGIDQLQRRFPVPVLGSIAIPMSRAMLWRRCRASPGFGTACLGLLALCAGLIMLDALDALATLSGSPLLDPPTG
jgi:hypothetical protein